MKFLFLLFFGMNFASGEPKWLDTTYDSFLTPQMKSAVANYRQYPLFWWNFVVVDRSGPPGQTEKIAAQICYALSESRAIRKLPCSFNLKNLKEFAESWIADTPLRREFPGSFDLEWQSTLAKAALPLPREVLEWLRRDPLNELEDLKLRLESRTATPFTRKGGLLIDEHSGRVLIPVQFSFPPTESTRTAQFTEILNELCKKTSCGGIHMFGPHSGNLENEMQIRRDLDVVSSIGIGALVFLFGFILYTRRQRLLLLFPVMGLGVLCAGVLTVLVFGRIHAVALSFGPALVSLAMDYGIHAAFLDPRAKSTWRSNFIALLTSLVIMALLGLSAIPLLQQMMFFAVSGLILTYGFFYLAMTRWPRHFAVEKFALAPRPSKPLAGLSFTLALAVLGLFALPLHLDIKQMNFQSAKSEQLIQWFQKENGIELPYTVVENSVEQSHAAKAWADANGIRYEGLANDLPPAHIQAKHKSTWQEFCQGDYFMRSEQAERFFPPFINLVCGERPEVPNYLADFYSSGKWLGVFFAANETQADAVKERFPAATSPREVIVEFPKIFAGELRWMLPVSLLGALLFLGLYYKNLPLALLSALPFACGVGAFTAMIFILNLPLNFISFMGLLMVFGFSIDYGIFAVDFMKDPTKDREGVWSALTICAATTITGFAPLAFAGHPVLNSLGHALLWGSVGTFIGSFWGVPAGFRFLRRKA